MIIKTQLNNRNLFVGSRKVFRNFFLYPVFISILIGSSVAKAQFDLMQILNDANPAAAYSNENMFIDLGKPGNTDFNKKILENWLGLPQQSNIKQPTEVKFSVMPGSFGGGSQKLFVFANVLVNEEPKRMFATIDVLANGKFATATQPTFYKILTPEQLQELEKGAASKQAEEKVNEGFNSFKIAAMKGDIKAQYNLGYMYTNGRGVPKDYAEAVKWYRKAADQGDAESQNNLGVMYDKGEGVPKDGAEAVKWFRKAADQGISVAQYNLGKMYKNGTGVPKDLVQAHVWWNIAGANGDKDAKKSLAIVEKEMTSDQKAEALNTIVNLEAEKFKSILIKEAFDNEWRDIYTKGLSAMIWIRKKPDTGYMLTMSYSDDGHTLAMLNHHNLEYLFPALVKWDEWTKAAKDNRFRPKDSEDEFYKRLIWTDNTDLSHFNVYFYTGRSGDSTAAGHKPGAICKLYLYFRIDKKGNSSLVFVDPSAENNIILKIEHDMGTGAQYINNFTKSIEKIDKRIVDAKNKISAMSRDETSAIYAERNKKEVIQAAPETIFK